MTTSFAPTFTGTTVVAPTVGVAARPALFGGTCTASHALDTIEGYVVRQTLGLEWDGTPRVEGSRVGADRATVWGATNYPLAIERALAYRSSTSYAVIDTLYSCGCRS